MKALLESEPVDVVQVGSDDNLPVIFPSSRKLPWTISG